MSLFASLWIVVKKKICAKGQVWVTISAKGAAKTTPDEILKTPQAQRQLRAAKNIKTQ